MTARTAPAPVEVRPGPLDRLLAGRIAVNWEVALYVAVFAAAFALRFWDLGERALHHDESIHAQWSWRLLQGDYKHSPVFHGPFYYHLQAAFFFVFGASDYTARLSAAVVGSAIVALPLLLRRRLGVVGTLAAVSFLAFSPTAVYYSRFFREDIYQAFFVLLMACTIWRYFASGRERWLIAFALAFTGAVTTKEGSFLTIGVFLVYLDVYLASQLAKATLRARDLDDPWRRLVLTGAYAPWAWVAASLWPLLGRVRKSLDWEIGLPRSGDVLVLLGTLTLPLLTPLLRPLLEKSGILATDISFVNSAGKQEFTSRLDWEHHLLGGITGNDQAALAGLFAVTVSAAAFVGLQWRAKIWTVAFVAAGLIYLTLMTSLWTNLDGLVSGPWGSLDYWSGQQSEYRGDQPWYYYDLLMPAYEFLPLVICVGGAWWSTVRGNAFSRFLVVWLVGQWLFLSWGSEKMPWNNTHLAVPACILAAWTVNRAVRAWQPRPALPRALMALGGSALASGAALLLIAFLPGGAVYAVARVVIALAALGVVAVAAAPFGRRGLASFAVAATVGALAVFSVRTMGMVTFDRSDDPRDMLIYTQTSPEIPRLMAKIDALAEATGKGLNMPIAVDSADSFSWPWAWYLRDYKAVSYADFTQGPPKGDFAVLLVNSSNVAATNDVLGQGATVLYGAPLKYPHRWWFDETYKEAMDVGNGACTGQFGDCGPFRLDTWKTIFDNVFRGDWLDTWFHYWRDHDPGRPNGSVDAYAYFPANFDMETGKLSARPLEPPKPTLDKSGHPQFGGVGPLPGQFFAPVDVEADAAGNLYVIDSVTKKLQKFDSAGNFLAAVDVRLNPADTTEQPWGLAIAPNGNVVVADTFGWRIRVFDKDLKPTSVTFGQAPDTSPGATIGPYDLFGPRDAVVDRDGNIWVTDTGGAHDRIVEYTATGQFIKAVGGSGKGPGQFDEPVGLAQASDGTFFVADMFNARVVMLDATGAYKGEFPVPGWGGQEATDKPYVRALRDGRVAVSLPALNEVRVYDRTGTLSGTITGSADEPLNRPYGMVETADGKLWVVEGGSGRVRLFPLP